MDDGRLVGHHLQPEMPRTVFSSTGGVVHLPDLVLNDRRDGGHLVVNPSRDVWERSELTFAELAQWSALVAATGWAMLAVLPQLRDGCINYWEAGNWSLHDEAEPVGSKAVRDHRRVHAHVIGRSRHATSDAWQWGEAPQFPRFQERLEWAAPFTPLTSDECAAIAQHIERRLRERYQS
jgi:diadenosine tetraphosphate (Ap4A) HIT family hydrolase